MHDLQLIEQLRNNESFTVDDVLGLLHVHIVKQLGLSKSDPGGFTYNNQLGKFIKNNFDFMQEVSKMAAEVHGKAAFTNNLRKSVYGKDMDHYEELYDSLNR